MTLELPYSQNADFCKCSEWAWKAQILDIASEPSNRPLIAAAAALVLLATYKLLAPKKTKELQPHHPPVIVVSPIMVVPDWRPTSFRTNIHNIYCF